MLLQPLKSVMTEANREVKQDWEPEETPFSEWTLQQKLKATQRLNSL